MPTGDRHGSAIINRDPLAFEPGSLNLSLEEFALDDDDEFFEIEDDGDTLSLTEWEGEWRSLTLRGELSIEEDLVTTVFPETDRPDPPGELVLAVDCEPTHRRAGHEISIDDFTEGSTPVELTVESADHYGTFTVTPLLIRTQGGSSSSTYRTAAGVELADGTPVTVEIDETGEGEDRILPTYFKSFSGSTSDRFPDDAVYVVDKSDLSRPKLFVNSDHESIRDALNSGPRGYIGHVMMVYRDLILLPAFSELILWTAEDVDADGSPPHEWQEALLSQLGPELYEDADDGPSAGESLYEEFHEEEAMTTLLDRTSKTLQDRFEVNESMNSLVDTLR